MLLVVFISVTVMVTVIFVMIVMIFWRFYSEYIIKNVEPAADVSTCHRLPSKQQFNYRLAWAAAIS